MDAIKQAVSESIKGNYWSGTVTNKAAKRQRLTLRERQAILSAIAFIVAGEYDEAVGDNPGFTLADMESATAKIRAYENSGKPSASPRT